ncbi:MAG TPA: glycerophosphodiester phosphodiesterase family protein, partial [Bacillota bacterium]|nr:glycerophosphodiester phosphodiesterase family protein [Bacillota bacterium]
MPMIFAHRGVRKDFPENTMPAFRAALTMGLEGIELDVQRTADGRLVICHDENLKRLTGNDLLLKDLTWEQLSALNAGFYFPGAPVERIPSLEEFFNWFAQTPLTVNIEIKNSVFPFSLIESEILDAIDHYHLRKRVIISSFNLQSV